MNFLDFRHNPFTLRECDPGCLLFRVVGEFLVFRTSARFLGRLLGLLLVLSGFGDMAWAISGPELDPASATSAVALLVGAALLAHDKFRQR